MYGIWKVLAYAAIPALGNLIGGALAEFIQVSRLWLRFGLHFAAGVIFAVIGMELIPDGLKDQHKLGGILAFMAGGLFFMLLDWTIDYIQTWLGDKETPIGPWVIYLGMSVEYFSDGVMIGAGSMVNPHLGFLLALSQLPANIPGAFVSIAAMKKQSIPRIRSLSLTFLSTLPIGVGALIGYLAVRTGPPFVKPGLLAFTAGLLLTVVVEAIMTEAHQEAESRLDTLFLLGGFALFALIALYF